MNIDTLPIGMYEENSYVLHDHGHVLLIDPGRKAKQIMACIGEDEIVDAVLLTHGHLDHTGAADDLCEEYGCPVYIHAEDLCMINGSLKGVYYAKRVFTPAQTLTEGDVTIGSFKVHVYSTPGHSRGSCLFQVRNVLFTGDTLFAGSIGRTDLYGGSEEQMVSSLKKIGTELSNDLKVLPGHGPASTIKTEKENNMYLTSVLQGLHV